MQRKTYNAEKLRICTINDNNHAPSNAMNVNHVMALLLISDFANIRVLIKYGMRPYLITDEGLE